MRRGSSRAATGVKPFGALDHVAASRGLYETSIDEVRREVRFQFKSPTDAVMLMSQRASWGVHASEYFKQLPDSALSRLFESWREKVDLTKLQDPGSLPPLDPLHRSDAMAEIVAWSKSTILPELDDKEDLGGFSLGQLRQFWSHFFVDCQMATRLEDYVDEVVGYENDLGSMMYQDSMAALAAQFARLYAIDAKSVEAMIDCLTFRPDSRKSTSAAHPFVKTADGTLSVLFRRAVLIDPDIMLSMALAKHSRRKIYDHVINKIEQRNTDDIGEEFRRAGFRVLTQSSITAPDGSVICPDWLIYEPSTRWLLIADYKHALPPLGAGEVSNKLLDLDGWTGQVRKYLQFARSHSTLVTARLGDERIDRADGMILFRWPLVIPGALQSDVTYADWPSLAVALRHVAGLAIRDILRFYRIPRDARQIARGWRTDEERVPVGEWTYVRPVVVGVTPAGEPA